MVSHLTTNEELSCEEWFDLLCRSYTTRGLTYRDKVLPAFPDDQTQINTVGAAGLTCLSEAYDFYKQCVRVFQKSALWHGRSKRLLDFGCGWGRVTRFFLYDFPPDNVLGVDVADNLVDLCRATFHGCTFMRCSPFPPASLSSESVDFVVGYSVFSHLSERACHEWLAEFRRILVPGGMVAITTRGRRFFDYCCSLANKGHAGYCEALSRMFTDFDQAVREYDSGRLVHSNIPEVTGGGALTGEFYGETFIPEKYAREVLSGYLEFVHFSYDGVSMMHPTLFFRKDANG